MVIAVVNQKGGVGKTSTALALTAGLMDKGYKVLGIDLDAQCNFSYTAGASLDQNSILDVLTGNCGIVDAIQQTNIGDVVPGDKSLSAAEAFLKDTGKEYRLKEALGAVLKKYDYVVIDTPPSLGILTINALTAANTAVIPAQADIYSLQGIGDLSGTIESVRKYCNPKLKIDGILLTRYNGRSILSRDVSDMAEEMADQLYTKVYTTRIREGVAVKEAQISRQSLQHYAPKAKVTMDYAAFIDEFLKGR